MSAVFFAKKSLPRMKKNKWGRLITITSYAVKQPVDGLLLSNSIRAAVTGLARTLANEYAAHGITVNNVCPGYTRTERSTIWLTPSPRAPARNQKCVFRRLETPNSRGPNRHARRIRRGGCVPRFGAGQLRERHFHRGGWRHCQESAIARCHFPCARFRTFPSARKVCHCRGSRPCGDSRMGHARRVFLHHAHQR